MRYVIAAVLVMLCIAPAMGLVVSPSTIQKTVHGQTVVSVTVRNNMNKYMHVRIEPNTTRIRVSPCNITLPPYSSQSITLTLPPNIRALIYYNWRYDVNNTTYTGVFEQPVKTVVQYKSVKIYPSQISLTIPENGTTDVPTILLNPSNATVSIAINTTLPTTYKRITLAPNTYKTVTYIVKGLKNQTYTIHYTVRYPYNTQRLSQEINVKVQTIKRIKQKIVEELKEKLKKLSSELNLPSQIRVDVGSARAGKPLHVTVTGYVNNTWEGLSKVPVKFENIIKFTDTQGNVYFTPSKAGYFHLIVYDRFGNVKYDKVVNVSKSVFNLQQELHDIQVGHVLRLTLPEYGTVTVTGENGIKAYQGKVVNITVDEPGEYYVTYNSTSYTGHGKFFATAKLVISASVNGRPLQPGETVKPGDKLSIKVTYPDGKLAKDVTLDVSVPAMLYGIHNMIVVASNQYFQPPYNIKMEYHQSSLILPLPKVSLAKEGIITISAEGNEYCTGSQLSVIVQPSIPFYEQTWFIGAAFVSAITLLAAAVLYRTDSFKFRDKLKSLKKLVREDYSLDDIFAGEEGRR